MVETQEAGSSLGARTGWWSALAQLRWAAPAARPLAGGELSPDGPAALTLPEVIQIAKLNQTNIQVGLYTRVKLRLSGDSPSSPLSHPASMALKVALFLLSTFFCAASAAGGDWKMLWSDEFDADGLDKSKWTAEVGLGCQYLSQGWPMCGWGNGELASGRAVVWRAGGHSCGRPAGRAGGRAGLVSLLAALCAAVPISKDWLASLFRSNTTHPTTLWWRTASCTSLHARRATIRCRRLGLVACKERGGGSQGADLHAAEATLPAFGAANIGRSAQGLGRSLP